MLGIQLKVCHPASTAPAPAPVHNCPHLPHMRLRRARLSDHNPVLTTTCAAPQAWVSSHVSRPRAAASSSRCRRRLRVRRLRRLRYRRLSIQPHHFRRRRLCRHRLLSLHRLPQPSPPTQPSPQPPRSTQLPPRRLNQPPSPQPPPPPPSPPPRRRATATCRRHPPAAASTTSLVCSFVHVHAVCGGSPYNTNRGVQPTSCCVLRGVVLGV